MVEENTSFLFEKNRLSSFKNWVFSREHSCSAEKMAEAGFIHVGSSKDRDSVKCFFCKKELDGWEQDDNPWEEHIIHAPKCKFALMKTPEDNMTLQQFVDLADAFFVKIIEDAYDKKISTLDEIYALVDSKNIK